MAAESRNKGAARAPDKKTMNFVRQEKGLHRGKCVLSGILLLAAVLIFIKIGIVTPLDRKTAAYHDLSRKQEQLAAVTHRLAGYEELKQQYGRYGSVWLTGEERNLVNPMDVLELVEQKIAPEAVIENMALNSNVLTMNLRGITLDQAGAMLRSLEQSPLVHSASIYNAVAQEAEEARIFITILLTGEEG